MENQSPAEKQFNNQVANSPIVKEIISDLDGLKEGQIKMEARMQSVEKKVDNGFAEMGAKIDKLVNVVTNNKEEALKTQLKKTEDALRRKTSNSDKLKNYSITGLIGTVATFVLENLGIINIVGQ
jgi:hypothetical protein